MDPLYFASIFGGVYTLIFLPFLCWMDIRTRNIDDRILIAYLIPPVPFVALLYASGLPYPYFIMSLVACAVWLIIRKAGAWGGADTKFLIIFSIVTPLNPLNGFQQGFQIMFIMVLAAVMLLTSVYTRNRKDLPMMVPISVAIVATMIIGALV